MKKLVKMLGVNYIYRFNPSFGIYVEAGAGAKARFITAMETVSKNSALGVETQYTYSQAYDGAFCFAYQAGVGIEVAKNLVIGCSFYDLGGAQVKGNLTTTTRVGGGTPNTHTNYNTLGTVHPMMILGRIGFCF